jgi:hypothetical protein
LKKIALVVLNDHLKSKYAATNVPAEIPPLAERPKISKEQAVDA